MLTHAKSMASLSSVYGTLPGLSEYTQVTELVYSFDHYASAPDDEDQIGRVFNNKAEQVKQKLWVSITLRNPILVV